VTILLWLLSLLLSALGVHTSIDVRVTSDGNGPEMFAVVCAWVEGEPQTLTCRQLEASR
jgi:hypothetical protein